MRAEGKPWAVLLVVLLNDTDFAILFLRIKRILIKMLFVSILDAFQSLTSFFD